MPTICPLLYVAFGFPSPDFWYLSVMANEAWVSCTFTLYNIRLNFTLEFQLRTHLVSHVERAKVCRSMTAHQSASKLRCSWTRIVVGRSCCRACHFSSFTWACARFCGPAWMIWNRSSLSRTLTFSGHDTAESRPGNSLSWAWIATGKLDSTPSPQKKERISALVNWVLHFSPLPLAPIEGWWRTWAALSARRFSFKSPFLALN